MERSVAIFSLDDRRIQLLVQVQRDFGPFELFIEPLQSEGNLEDVPVIQVANVDEVGTARNQLVEAVNERCIVQSPLPLPLVRNATESYLVSVRLTFVLDLPKTPTTNTRRRGRPFLLRTSASL